MQQLKGLILDPDKKSRVRLKTATDSLDEFGAVTACSDERETLKWVDRYDKVDIVFVSEKLDQTRVGSFIEQVKQCSNCMSAVFVVIKPNSGSGLSAADALMLGADAILCEPFSADGLSEVVQLAERLGRERDEVRNRIAITLLVTDLINQLDATSVLVSEGLDPVALRKSLANLGEKLQSMTAEQRETYFDILVRLTSKATPMNKHLATKVYHGVSARVRRNTELKICREIASFNRFKDGGNDEGNQ